MIQEIWSDDKNSRITCMLCSGYTTVRFDIEPDKSGNATSLDLTEKTDMNKHSDLD